MTSSGPLHYKMVVVIVITEKQKHLLFKNAFFLIYFNKLAYFLKNCYHLYSALCIAVIDLLQLPYSWFSSL